MTNMCNVKEQKINKEHLATYKKIKRFSLLSFFMKLVRLLGKFLASCIILVIAAHFVPELRESMPELYLFIEEVGFKLINWAYGTINNNIL